MYKDIFMLSNEFSKENRHIKTIEFVLHQSYKLHFHDYFEIEIIAGGEGKQVLNGKSYPLKKGSAYLLRPTDFHSIETIKPLEIYKIIFDETMLSNTLSIDITASLNDYFAELSEEEFSQLINIAEALFLETQNATEMHSVIAGNLLECVIISIMRKNAVVINDTKDLPLRQALSYIHLNYRNNITLGQTAKSVNMTPNYFSHWFHKNTGKPYIEYLNKLRLSYAEKMLMTSDRSITDICFLSGFSSVSNFLKEFKKKNLTTPSKFKEKFKEN